MKEKWNRAGEVIEGKYLDQFPYKGEVVESAVIEDNVVVHTVKLEQPILVNDSLRFYVIHKEEM